MAIRELTLPLSTEAALALRAGEEVRLTGEVYTARDIAHRRLIELVKAGRKTPFDLANATIFYAGPASAPPGKPCGSIGPTTSGRMDLYTPELIKAGVRAMIGKGPRSPEVVEAMRRYGAVYFAAAGGASAFLSTFVVGCTVLAWPELGTEAVWRLEIKNLPVFLAIDVHGGNIFRDGREEYRVVRG